MLGRQQLSYLAAALLAGAALAAPVQGAAQTGTTAQTAAPFRICTDPDNLPFSSANPATPGLYVELGRLIAQSLDRPFDALYTVSYFGKRTVRTTLLAGKCDAYIGLPDSADFMGPQLVFSKPFLQVGYALMVPPGLPIHRLDDLTGKAIAVQFSTPPQLVLAGRDDMRSVTFVNPGEAAEALVTHRVDAAFIWGPIAGYVNVTTLHGGFQVIPVSGEDMQWPVSVGFAKFNTGLRDEVDNVLQAHKPQISELAAKYGLPGAGQADTSAAIVKIAATEEAANQPAPTAPTADDVAAGREIFNGTCGHCHGPDAVQSERRINLRLLEHRYGDKMAEVYHYTVTHGRLDKGMPNWTGVFTDEDFTKILAFLRTVQSN